ncbi:phage tail protein [Ameyamaea chiangmaiensis]|uniref:phage tail tip lysozyme n=1 Tax=Ameyamaea chiangmaiensis TaxID=442969 RepID=UPI001BB05369|nr:phage tail tip lysozyme [Ameyamaea chiangmaiensis]MBS4075472.1 phage tail protein [Ameyamaea chiangmaiensis]
MTRSLTGIVPVLGTITGAASLAGIYRLGTAWAEAGTKLRTTSRAIGMDPRRLQAMGNAAKLAGGSADAMTDALATLSSQQWNAGQGLDPSSLAKFQAFGLTMRDLKDLGPDKVFEHIAHRLREIHNPMARTVATFEMFGGAASSLLPIFQMTDREWNRMIQTATRHSHATQAMIDAADRLREKQTDLEEAVTDFGYALAYKVEPVLSPIIDLMRQWIEVNGTWLSQKIGDYVKQFTDWLRNGGWGKVTAEIRNLYGQVENVVDELGGWKNAGRDALIAVTALYAAPILSGLGLLTSSLLGVVGALTRIGKLKGVAALGVGYGVNAGLNAADPGDRIGTLIDKYLPGASAVDNVMSYVGMGRSYAEQNRVLKIQAGRAAYSYFRGKGLSDAEATGLVANIDQESGFQFNRSGDNGAAYGIGQWHADRQKSFARLFGHDIRQSRYSEQLAFMLWELDNSESGAGRDLRGASSAQDAARIASSEFFRPADSVNEPENRAALAGRWASLLNGAGTSAPGAAGLDLYSVKGAPAVQMPTSSTPMDAYDRLKADLKVSIENKVPNAAVRVAGSSGPVTVHHTSGVATSANAPTAGTGM